MSAARNDLCEVSPMTQRRASTRFDLPQPFGPTTPVSPGSIRKSVGSTKDLKPTRRRRVSFTGVIRLPLQRERVKARVAGLSQRGGRLPPPVAASPRIDLSREERGAGGQTPSIGLMIFSISSIDRFPVRRSPLMKKVGVELTLNLSSARFRTAFTAS